MAKFFFLRLAVANVRRNRLTYLPYLIATAVMSGVFMLMTGLAFSDSLANLPNGRTAAMIFTFGLALFAIFTFFFMVYINNFLIGRRKKEFGLYGILGLNKRHIGRVLVWENLIVIGGGVLLGMAAGLLFGRLLFLLLAKLIHCVPGSEFRLAPAGYWATAVLYALVFLVTSVINLVRVRLASPIALLQSEKRGERDSKLLIPGAILGTILLGVAYYFAWTIENPGMALGLFFPLAFLVILATYALFAFGSIALLRILRANKRFYYRPENFVTISGMFHRMRQNARGLAAICVLSCMLVVSVSGTLALYLGQEDMLRGMYPFDATMWLSDATEPELVELDEALVSLAKSYNVTLTSDRSKLIYELPEGAYYRNNYVFQDAKFAETPNLICMNETFRYDVEGAEEDCLAFVKATFQMCSERYQDRAYGGSDVFSARQEGYGTFGGLLFLGVFFGALFLAVTVLILYFKQITEGYEDKERFEILQKVGMDDTQVRKTIDRQVLWVFFLPLAAAAMHMVFASKMMARMLMTFMLYDWGLVLTCIGGTLLAFALLYFTVYRLTARTYYRIVKR